MIGLKQAAQSAEAAARDLYSEAELASLRLEEAELSDDGRSWLITLGWVEQPAARVTRAASPGGLLGTLAPTKTEVLALPRVYKQFVVDAETGRVAALKIRDV